MDRKLVAHIFLAMSIGVLLGAVFGPGILENPSSFSIGVLVGAVYGPIIGNTPSVYLFVMIGIALCGVLLGWLSAAVLQKKNI